MNYLKRDQQQKGPSKNYWEVHELEKKSEERKN